MDIDWTRTYTSRAPCMAPHPRPTVEEDPEPDVDAAAALQRRNDPVRQRIPVGWVLHVDEVFDDMPKGRINGLRQKQKQKQKQKKDRDPKSPTTSPPVAPAPLERGVYHPAPSLKDAKAAHADLSNLLRPRKKNGIGYLHFDGDDRLHHRLEQMRMFLYRYINGVASWMVVSPQVVTNFEETEWQARNLRDWTRTFITDRHSLPRSKMGTWNESLIDKKPELKAEINLYLQSIGKYVRALDIVEFLEDPLVQLRHGLERGISLSTAQVWMHKLDYRWTKAPKGQFVDGHERLDVVDYRNKIFLPALEELNPRIRLWSKDGTEVPVPDYWRLDAGNRRVVIWYHDESTFYAHDRRLVYWQKKTGKGPKPKPKGEGISLMVADFVSADYGWLTSPDGNESARVLFKAGKNREGYFTNEEILEQATKAMDILQRHYPNEDHILVYDNAPTHLKRPSDALSAKDMSMKPTSKKRQSFFFGVKIPVKDEVTGKMVYGSDGAVLKKKIPMTGAKFANGSPQSLYFPPDHQRAGVFKGMKNILNERGIDVTGLRAQCPNFKCEPPALDCCCRRILFNQPDFADVESCLETHCKERSFRVLFLPKFHCELNPIEQCWGAAKREYRMYPESSLEAGLERNVVKALATVNIISIRRFCTRTRRFMDGYRYGLTGKAAAYAEKKYHGHRVLPQTILEELELEGQLELVT